MAGTGLLVAFETVRLVGIQIMKFGYPPLVFWFHLFPVTLFRLLIGVTVTSRPRLPMPQRRC